MRAFLYALAAIVVIEIVQNVALARLFPEQARFAGDFSPAYLRRDLRTLAALPPQTLFLGDGLLAGFRLRPEQTAVAILTAEGCACRNLAYKHGSPVNYYALARLMQAYRIRPRAVVLEINQAQFNPAYFGYRRLPGAVGEVAWPLMTPSDRDAIVEPKTGLRQRVERVAGSLSLLVAMRTDIREALFGAADPKPPPLGAAARRALYDPAPLNDGNLSVRYLGRTLDVLHAIGAPAVGFLAPTNHIAFRGIVDKIDYRRNNDRLRSYLARRGVRVLDFDSALAGQDFSDEVHLNATGQRHLAALLATGLRLRGDT